MESPAVTSAEWWAQLWENIEHWAFLGVVLTLAIEFAASHFIKAPRKIIDDARQVELAQLTKETETLRSLNLELEKAVSPRWLEQGLTSARLRAFAGTLFVVVSPTDFEPKRTAGQIRWMLSRAGWIKYTDSLGPQSFGYFDGVAVHILGPMANGAAAANALIEILNENKIAARIGYPMSKRNSDGRADTRANIDGPTVIIVEVGPKPLPESMQLKPEDVPAGPQGRIGGNIEKE